MDTITILLLEDNLRDAELVTSVLAQGEMKANVDRVDTGSAFQSALQSRRYDIILADYVLPNLDGLAALALARQYAPDTPFLLVSGTLGEEVAIEALKHGATDYLVKQRLERLVPAVRRALGEARERTERRRAQNALWESQELFRRIVDSAQDYAIFTLDLNGRITSWNSGARRLLGYEEAEILGRDDEILYTPEDRAQQVPRLERDRALASGRAGDDRWHVRRDETRFWASGLVTLLRDDTGAVRGFVKILRDMTVHKQMEDEIREASRRKEAFIAMLAHELRGPLAPVRNALHVLRFQAGDVDAVNRLRELMERQIGHLSRLISDLLDVSRIRRGKIQLRRERLDLGRQVRLTVEDRRRTLEEAGLTISMATPETPVWVSADATRLAQILDNLLENAGKFTERGGHITVLVETDPEHRQAIVRVRDTGIGMEPELLAQLFEPFAQADRGLDRAPGGLGLGLALIRGLVELHGGTVRATSAGLGRGTEFILTFPQEPEPQALTDKPASKKPARKGLRILVVEDNKDAANTLRVLLEMFGYQVTVAYTGKAGVEAAREGHPDVVLCDIGLPEMDGFAVANALRKNPETAGARLIAVTGYGQEADRRRALEAGFNEHLTKPVDPELLLGQLEAKA
jgi:PAS domain S-box-containing protein